MRLALEGIILEPQRNEKFWSVGVPLIEIYSQGRSRRDALKMIVEAVRAAVDLPHFRVEAKQTGDKTFALCANDAKILIAFLLKQRRVAKKLSFRKVAQKLGSSSPNSYSRYEQGDSATSIEKLLELMGAVSEEEFLLLKTG